jgi:tRNA A-37 threonylcarbamoyl transferase component Bud32
MDVVGGYELLGRVATGRSSTVWKARDPVRGRDLAVKQVPLHAGEAVTRLRAMARVLIGVVHPNIVEVVDFTEERHHAWLFEDWVDGVSLATLLTSIGRLLPQQAVGVVRGVLSGLAFAHGQAIVHGDVSPSAILLDTTGTPRLVDFGLSAPSGYPATSATAGYLCPEAVLAHPVTPAGDVYSAGAVLATLLLGRPAFPGASRDEILARQLSPAGAALSGIAPPLQQVLERAMATDQRDRYTDAEQFGRALDLAAEQTYGTRWSDEAGVASLVPSTAPATAPASQLPALVSGADEPGTDPVLVADALVPRGSQVVLGSTRGPQHASVRADDLDRLRARTDLLGPRPTATAQPLRTRIVNAFKVPGRMSATGAGIVVILAISILVVMHATGTTVGGQPSASTKSSSPGGTATSSNPGLAFNGTYRITETMKTTVGGVGINLVQGTWQVQPSCASECTASVTSSMGAPFELILDKPSWKGTVAVSPVGCAGGAVVGGAQLTISDASKSAGSTVQSLNGTMQVSCGSETQIWHVTATRSSSATASTQASH